MLRITADITNLEIRDMLKDTDSGEISNIPSPLAYGVYVETRLEIWTRRFNCAPFDHSLYHDAEIRQAFKQIYDRISDVPSTKLSMAISGFDSWWDQLDRLANSAYTKNRSYMDAKRFAEQREDWPNLFRIIFMAMFTRIYLMPTKAQSDSRAAARVESRKRSLRESQAKHRTTQKNTYTSLMHEMDTVERLISKIDVQIAELQAKRAESVDARTQIQARIDRWGPESASE
jgi:hypothetical protein